MENQYSLCLNARLEDLEDIRRFIAQHASSYGLDASRIYDIELATTEMVTNTIVHGYKRQPGPVEVTIQVREWSFEVYIRDQAPLFDPTQATDPDLTIPLEKRPFGGMGIYLTRQMVDQFFHNALPEGGNEVILVINRQINQE